MNQKAVLVPFEGGYAKLLFDHIDGEWVCKMDGRMMKDLQCCLNGDKFPEYVEPYIDLGPLGD